MHTNISHCIFCISVYLSILQLNDRRGHRKLRLDSRKHFKPKPKSKPKSLPISIPLKDVSVLKVSWPLSFKVSLPLSSFNDTPVESLEKLHCRLKQSNVIPSGKYNDSVQILCIIIIIGWISTIQNEELRIFQLGYLKSSTEVLRSLTIREDFSWVVSYKKEAVNPSHCDLLKDVPSSLNSSTLSFLL